MEGRGGVTSFPPKCLGCGSEMVSCVLEGGEVSVKVEKVAFSVGLFYEEPEEGCEGKFLSFRPFTPYSPSFLSFASFRRMDA